MISCKTMLQYHDLIQSQISSNISHTVIPSILYHPTNRHRILIPSKITQNPWYGQARVGPAPVWVPPAGPIEASVAGAECWAQWPRTSINGPTNCRLMKLSTLVVMVVVAQFSWSNSSILSSSQSSSAITHLSNLHFGLWLGVGKTKLVIHGNSMYSPWFRRWVAATVALMQKYESTKHQSLWPECLTPTAGKLQ